MTATASPAPRFDRHPDYMALNRAWDDHDDLARLAPLCDWLEEYCQNWPGREDKRAAKELAYLKGKMKAHREAVALHAALERVDLAAVPLMSAERHIGRKNTAKLARDLFKRLGLKGISVTAPDYSMASTVDVQIPYRRDYARPTKEQERDSSACYWLRKECPVHQANEAAEKKIGEILAIAFPNHDDRSDSQTDYFDRKWSFGKR